MSKSLILAVLLIVLSVLATRCHYHEPDVQGMIDEEFGKVFGPATVPKDKRPGECEAQNNRFDEKQRHWEHMWLGCA